MVAIKSYRFAPGKRRLHIARAERALGHPLPPKAQVHHADGSKSDNAPLVICQDYAYHRLLHVRAKVLQAGGNPNTDKVCCDCGAVKALDAFGIVRTNKSDGHAHICRDCHNARQQRRRDADPLLREKARMRAKVWHAKQKLSKAGGDV
jgi:hypothetical protein